MAKKYGSVVLLALGDALVNALVVQSVPQADGEHLVVFYLDPAHEATAMSGQSVDAAIKKDFVTPLTEGKKFGWKDLPAPVLPTGGAPSEEAAEQVAPDPSPNLQAAAAIIEQQSALIKVHRQRIADLEAELKGVKTELATTTEGIDKQLQGIADATAAAAQQAPGDPAAENSAKEAAPEAPADPSLFSSQTSPESDSPPTGQDAIPKDSTTETE